MHRENRAVAGPSRRPGRKHRCDALGHALDIAGQVVQRVRDLQRQRIARLPTQQPAEPRLGELVVVVE